eukprot:5591044-Amphidinium_carterae.1
MGLTSHTVFRQSLQRNMTRVKKSAPPHVVSKTSTLHYLGRGASCNPGSGATISLDAFLMHLPLEHVSHSFCGVLKVFDQPECFVLRDGVQLWIIGFPKTLAICECCPVPGLSFGVEVSLASPEYSMRPNWYVGPSLPSTSDFSLRQHLNQMLELLEVHTLRTAKAFERKLTEHVIWRLGS